MSDQKKKTKFCTQLYLLPWLSPDPKMSSIYFINQAKKIAQFFPMETVVLVTDHSCKTLEFLEGIGQGNNVTFVAVLIYKPRDLT